MKIKNAFTLAELLIAFAIIGIISVSALYTFKKYDKGIRYLYSNTYHQIDRALYNGLNFSDLKNPFASKEIDPDTEQEIEVTPEMGAQRLCLMIAEYLNGGASCSQGVADPSGGSLGSVQFTTNNGAQIYISKRLPEEDNPNYHDGDHLFFILFVDLNGPEPPNTMDYEPMTPENSRSYKDPDTFAFAALDTGRLCPLGPPEIDPRYMQSRVAYLASVSKDGNNQNDDERDDTLITKYTTVSTPYYIAKAQAWGFYMGDNDDFSPIDDEPTSYNDYIRRMLPEGNNIYKFMKGAERITLPADFPGMLNGLGCEPRFNEQCWVIVDRYLF